MFTFPIHQPAMTWGLGNRASYVPGPSGPIPDPRRRTMTPGPIYGRVGSRANFLTSGIQIPGAGWAPWAQMPSNNSFATGAIALFWPGWIKPPPTSTSGF
jgi:hypothetical protein